MVIRERIIENVLNFMDEPVIKVLTGMRRSGKSILLEQIIDELINRGINRENIIYINFESMRYEHLKDYVALFDEVTRATKTVKGKIYLFLDEISEVNGWENAVNTFRLDLDCDMTITGSNARTLTNELDNLLKGRYVEIPIYPLDFKEYLEFAANNTQEASFNLLEHFAHFLRLGGLPGIHNIKWEENITVQYLSDIYNTVLLQDVVAPNKIRDVSLLEAIVQYILENVGNLYSAKTISDHLRSRGRKLSTETVYTYLNALEDSYLIRKAPRYDIKARRLLETQEKYFLTDLGLRHALLGNRGDDISGLLENVVYLELCRRGYTVKVGKQGKVGVDFVADRGDERLYAQVTYILNEDTTTREFRPLMSIADHHEKLVITADTGININLEGIRSKNILEFLMES